MSHHTASLQAGLRFIGTAHNLALAVADQLYWLDDHYFQPFVAWAKPRLVDAAITALLWAIVALVMTALWLIDTTQQFLSRDQQAIALLRFAEAHPPLPVLPALAPATIPLALPSAMVALAPAHDLGAVGNKSCSTLALRPAMGPAVLPNPTDSVDRWLAATLPLVAASWATEAMTVPVCPAIAPGVPAVTEAAPVLKKSRKAAKATGKTPRKRSPKKSTTTTAAAP